MSDAPPPRSRSTRRSLLQAGSLVLLLGAQQIARGAAIVAVRVWPAQDYSRVTIESDRQLVAKQFFVATPPRLAVDIEGIDLNPCCASWWPGSCRTTPTSPASAWGRTHPAWCAWWWI